MSKDRDKTWPPTEADLRKLPRWAAVAFAARCARRVLPLFREWDRSAKYTEAVEAAVVAAEGLAAHNAYPDAYPNACADVGDADYAADIATAADSAARAAGGGGTAAALVATTAAAAAHAASHAAARAAARVVVAAATAAAADAHAAALVAAAADSAADSAMWLDYHHLYAVAAAGRWTDATPVPPTFFGPLWPDGPPAGWPTDCPAEAEPPDPPADRSRPDVVVVWDPAVVTPSEYAELVAALGDLVRAEGGLGLERVDARGFGARAGKGVRS